MRNHIPLAAVLACAAVACSERPSPVGPAAVAAAAALSRGGAPTPNDPTPFVDPVASGVCGFPVQLAFGGKSKAIELPGGRTLYTGPGFTATVTNLATGRTETLNITGAFHTTTLANGDVEYVVTGRNLLAFDPAAGSVFVLASGRFTFTVDAAGTTVQTLQGNGRLTDVCALLS